MMKMSYTIPHQPTPIKIPALANIQTRPINTGLFGNIYQPIYNTGPCSSCGK
jgi:hypothetical protein